MDPSTQPQVTPPSDQVQNASALAQPIVQAASTVAQPEPQTPSRAKETGPATSNELAAFVEVVGNDSIEKEPLPPEVSSWMEKVNRDTSGEKPPEIVVPTESHIASQGAPSTPLFVLPLGESEMNSGLHQGVGNSVRWLSEWCKRLVKKLGGQTSFE